MVIAQPVEDQLELSSGRSHRTDIAVAAAMRHLVSDRADATGRRQDFHRFDRRPPHQTRALLGDVPAVNGGVGLVISRSQPCPTRQLGRAVETMYITDLGDEHRRQHGPDAGDLLDRGVAGVMGQPTLRQTGEHINFGVERFDEPAQPSPRAREDVLGVVGGSPF